MREPRYKPQPNSLSCEEIRFWLSELQYKYGWTSQALAEALGIRSRHLCLKRSGSSWIYPGQQARFSRQIRAILEGKIVCRQVGPMTPRAHVIRSRPVPAEHPVPLHQPARLRYNLATGRLEWRRPVMSGFPTLPSFKDLLKRDRM
jgi:hypothetical protein